MTLGESSITPQNLNRFARSISAFQYGPRGRATLGKEDWIVLLFLLVAVLFGLLILIFVVVLSRDKQHKRKCPFCAESVMLDAKICKHCGRELTPEAGA